MNKIHEAMRIFAQMKEKRKGRRDEKRIDDLFKKVHVYNKNIVIPLPNLYALNEIINLYDSIDRVDLNRPDHLASLLVILENQENPEYARLSPEEKRKLTDEKMRQIPAGEKEDYTRAVYEVLLSLKKNSIRKTREMLEKSLQTLDLAN